MEGLDILATTWHVLLPKARLRLLKLPLAPFGPWRFLKLSQMPEGAESTRPHSSAVYVCCFIAMMLVFNLDAFSKSFAWHDLKHAGHPRSQALLLWGKKPARAIPVCALVMLAASSRGAGCPIARGHMRGHASAVADEWGTGSGGS